MENSDDLIQVQNFCEIDTSNLPPLPRFPFAENLAVHLDIDVSDGTLQFLDIFFNGSF